MGFPPDHSVNRLRADLKVYINSVHTGRLQVGQQRVNHRLVVLPFSFQLIHTFCRSLLLRSSESGHSRKGCTSLGSCSSARCGWTSSGPVARTAGTGRCLLFSKRHSSKAAADWDCSWPSSKSRVRPRWFCWRCTCSPGAEKTNSCISASYPWDHSNAPALLW